MEILILLALVVLMGLVAVLLMRKPTGIEGGPAAQETARALGQVESLQLQIANQRQELEEVRSGQATLVAERSQLLERERQAQAAALDARQRAAEAESRFLDQEAKLGRALADLQIAAREIEYHKAECAKQTAGLEQQIALYQKLSGEHNQKCTDFAQIKGELEVLQKQLAERQDDIAKTRQELQAQFQNAMNELLDVKARALKEDSKNSVAEMLTPVKEQLSEFAKRVDNLNSETSKQHGTLAEKLSIVEKMNETLSQEARNLAQALRGDAKVMGDWGEVTLERVLQAAGLSDLMYTKQDVMPSLDGEEGVLRSDFLIRLPDERFIVIDSKVSLNAYVDYTRAESDLERSQAADRLLGSLQAHVQKLAESEYHQRINSPEFTFMFVPHDPIFNLAVQRDPNLVSKAYQRRVLMVTPSTLVVALKVVTELWQRDTAARSQQRLIELAGNIYNKLHDGLQNLERVGESLDKAKGTYDRAMVQLVRGKGNLLKSADQMKKIGGRKVKATKSLEESFPRMYADALDDVADEEPALESGSEAEEI